MRRKSLHQKFDHVLRKARRLALANNATAYRMYMWLCDNEHKFYRLPQHADHRKSTGYAMIEHSFRKQGWQSASLPR